ncbi:hypothetical protein DPEC_G00314720 [Dallia pectoralis]|uniref:Uncharacterized protein n=1 Tax=Dallia pectoralis TaxID=75939 RepID=A0ACC2FC35_DALPE|nr:hypothetical protein DPEC_G00314720 [Dallia pectoralis]
MRDLAAQVTSSLLRFPGVTIGALAEDEITLDSVLQGKFTVGRSGLAWLSCGPQLEVVHAVTGERLSAYCFSGGGEHLPSVLAARDFSWLKRTGLLIGLEEAQGSMLCLYDLGISRVVKAVVIPGRITAIEPLVSYGGASASTQHLHQSLRWFFGVAAVVTDLGHVFLLDLCLDDLSCGQSELEASDLEVVTKSLSEIPRLREQDSRQGRHLCLQLSSPTGTSATALHYIPRTNQLAVGFSDGYLQLWNMKTLKKEYHSQLEGGRVPVYAFTFQEPENDPRNCCYLWAVQSAQDHEGDVVSLHLLQLAFSERKCLTSGKILYEGLEYCEERYSQELGSAAFPLRAQTTNTRLLSCQTIEKFRHHPDRDDSVNEVASPDTSVSIFSWQVKAYGQGSPTTYISVFDINRWYHAQMPDSLRPGESLRSCPYLAVWSLDSVVEMTTPCPLLDVLVHERSLSRGLPYTCPPPEQFFNPTMYNFDATCLLNTGIVHFTCSGYQKETLSFLKKAAPCSSDAISNGYSRCLMSGLLSARLADVQPSCLSQEEQLNAILSTAVETSSLGLITGCIKQWTAEEQPGSAVNLRYILEWAWDKVVHTKKELDAICAPLFDSSSNFTDPQTLQHLQHSQRLLANLSTIFHCLLNEAQELTQRGLLGLINKNLVSSLISQYAQVVLWFCRTGLLPEVSDEDAVQISRPFYSYSVIENEYTIRREEMQHLSKGKWCADCLMIDGLVAQCGDRLVDLWKRDEGGTGLYPPSSLHALLDIYLLENIDESAKHAIVIYLLLDVMYSFPTKGGPSVESFPTAFAIPFSLVKLVQGLWLLDHHDHQNSLELLLHPTTSHSPFSWQHSRVLQALMCQRQHTLALRYLHVMKPPLSSTAQTKLSLSVLLHNRCLVEACTMLRQRTDRLNSEELLRFLYETCQELGLMKELLKLPLGLAEQECLERFLQGTGGLQNRELLMVHYLQQANYVPALQLNHTLRMNMVNERDPKLKERSSTRNSILDQYGKVLPRAQRKLAMERASPYHHPSTILHKVSRPQPLSTIAKRPANENVLTRAAFINSVLSKIEEVWMGKNPTPQSSPLKSPQAAELLCPSPLFPSRDLPQAFVGTPITMSSKRKSRLLDLVVHPSCQMSPLEGSRPLLTPPRASSSWNIPTKSIPELSLLQTPQVVKRARALAASGPVFPSFTPQSILRSSLRPTPMATPSASPGRSVTPPPRLKESRITFIEATASPETDKGPLRWSNGIASEKEISSLTRGSTLPKAGLKAWISQPFDDEDKKQEEEEEGEQMTHVKFLRPPACEPLPETGESESGSSVQEVVVVPVFPSLLPRQLSLGLDTSQASIPSTDTTLEFHDAPLPEVADEDEVVVNFKTPAVSDALQTKEEARPAAANEPPLLVSMEGLEQDRVINEVSIKSQDEVVVVQEPDQEVEAMEVCAKREGPEAEQEGQVQSKHTQEAQSDTEANNEQSIDQDVLEVSTFDHEMEMPQEVEVEEERPPELDKSQPTELIEHVEPLQPVDSMDNVEPVEETPPLNCTNPLESTEHPDLDQFVADHLFGNDLSPPLSRTGIHEMSDNWTSFTSEPVCSDGEEDPTATPPVLITQKSVASVTSSDTNGTDSNSVVSLNDSEELSSTGSVEGEEASAESEDSGSEVEIIEEVQGNGRQRAPMAPPTLFLDQIPPLQQHPLSEQDTAVLSLVTSEADLKMVDNDMEGEVLMVRLGAGEHGEEGICYTELKPSTTLLVPVELVEGQALAAGARLELTEVVESREPDVPTSGAHSSSFSLILEADDDGDTIPVALEETQKPEEPPTTPAATEEGTSDTVNTRIFQDTAEAEPLVDNVAIDGLGVMEGVMGNWTEAVADGTAAASEVKTICDSDVLPETSEAVAEDALIQTETARSNEGETVSPEPEMDEMFADSEPAEAELFPVLNGTKKPNGDGWVAEAVSMVPQTVLCARSEKVLKTDAVEFEPEAVGGTCVPVDPTPSQVQSNGPVQAVNHDSAWEETAEMVTASLEEAVHLDVTSNSQSVSGCVERTSEVQTSPVTPSRRATRQWKNVTFTLEEAEAAGSEEDGRPTVQMVTDSPIPTTPRRVTRSTRHALDSPGPVTPRRSARKIKRQLEPEPLMEQNEEAEGEEEDVVLHREAPAVLASPTRRRTLQTATPKMGARRSRSAQVGGDEELPALDETANDVALLSVNRSTRKTRTGTKILATPTQTLEKTANDGDANQRPSSPARVTRNSTRASVTLALFTLEEAVVAITPTRRRRKARDEGTAEKTKETSVLPTTLPQDVPPLSGSRRPTRSRLWNNPEEDLPLLETPLEVDSRTPVADALIQRLRDEDAKRKVGKAAVFTEVMRPQGRSGKPVGQLATATPPLTEELMVPEADHGSPVRDSFIYSPARRRTRVSAESPGQNDTFAPPITRTRRTAPDPGALDPIEKNKIPSGDDVEKEAPAPKPRTTKRRTTKSKAASVRPPPAQVDPISPLPSPANPAPSATKRVVKENDAPPPQMNLRRKRVLEAIFPKPVTRRKKL